MIRTTSFVHLVPTADPHDVEHLIDVIQHAADELDLVAGDAASTTSNAHRAGDVMLLGAFTDEAAYEQARHDPYVTTVLRPLVERCAAHVETVRYRQGPVEVRDPGLEAGIHRTLLIRVDPGAAPAAVERFEADLRDMPRYIDSIRNASLSRVDVVHASLGPEYTHVWEQEFVDLDGLTGAYMAHGYHWSLVDTWFDPQAPDPIVDPTLIHSSCGLRRSILART